MRRLGGVVGGDGPVVCDNSALLGEALHVLGLLAQERARDEEREVRVLPRGAGAVGHA